MEEINYTKKFNEMFSEFYKAGGCLEIKVFKPEEKSIKSRKELHFLTAIKTVHNELLKEDNQQDFFEYGKKISTDDFFGGLVDVKNKRVIVIGKDKKWNQFYYHDNEEEVSIKYMGTGVGYAFLHPPYHLKLKDSVKEEGDFFFEFFNELFGELNQIEVYEWSTDFSSYFDAGKEWWGEFYWTVYSFEKDLFIGITASTSD